ncbi:MAG: hypothetical protein U5P10_11520 [Spirochaetia bacterium]|nr:hypothetical protein [Spirochaetia bacterium]
MITPIFWLAPITSLIALGAAFYFYKQTLKESEGTALGAAAAGCPTGERSTGRAFF